jgi:hypothetical protein
MVTTSRELFDASRHMFKTVPSVALANVCHLCLGPTKMLTDYAQCASCYKLFYQSACPSLVEDRVVPMTIAENPSPWYSALYTYKKTQFREHGGRIGALAYRWLRTHEEQLAALLGGDADYVTVVPSKRGISYEWQPLKKALSLVRPMGQMMREVLSCPKQYVGRLTTYKPELFNIITGVDGDRIVLVEDTWISGATALSAAGALLEAGAESVVLTPIAREMKPLFWGKTHVYCGYIDGEYDIDFWPR